MANLLAIVEGVSKRYNGVQALDSINFSINRGEVRALLGKNGAGKSTLIRLLSGAESADSGSISINDFAMEHASVQIAHKLGVRTVYQELSLIPDMTVAENLFMGRWIKNFFGLNYPVMNLLAEEALFKLGLSIDPKALVGSLSIADQQLVEITRAISDDPSLLILDEPTSSLGALEVDRVLDVVNSIKQSGVSVVYVSHRLAEIKRIADSVTVMRNGKIVETKRLTDTSTKEVIRAMVGDVEVEKRYVYKAHSSGMSVIELNRISLNPKLKEISFEIKQGEVLGIAGVLGSGRTELMQIIAGLRRPSSGTIKYAGRVMSLRNLTQAKALGIGITPEDRKNDGIIIGLGIDENLVMADWKKVSKYGVINSFSLRKAVNKAIASMSIKTSSGRTLIGTLSGGNQQKVVIGRWLHADSNVLLLDEPTRGVDIEAKGQIYELLRKLADADKAVVFVSSEMDEIELVCDRVLVLSNGVIKAEFCTPNINTDSLLLAALEDH